MATPSRPVQSVDNTELYNRWAQVYDTDGNILQAIDDHLFLPLLSQALSLLASSSPLTITELGCGTGRNTAKLCSPPTPSDAVIEQVNALDLSPGMLEVARSRCSALVSAAAPAITFEEFDALQSEKYPRVGESMNGRADLVLSTLVLEHLPLAVFFRTAAAFLKPGRNKYLILTNMHSEMGNLSRAGFVDPVTGEKVRGDSYAHTIGDVLAEGEKWGFEIVGKMHERSVMEDDVGHGIEEKEALLGPRGKKWIGVKVWFGCLMKYEGRNLV